MTMTSNRTHARLAGLTLTLTAWTLFSAVAWADIRQEAVSVMEHLHQSGIAAEKPEEVRSTETTFATAELYSRANNPEQSERFYLLTLQKAGLILASIPGRSPSASATERPEFIAPETAVADPPLTPEQTQMQPDTAADLPMVQEDLPSPDAQFQSLPGDPEQSSDDITSEKLVGRSSTYTVVSGDTLRLVAAKLGVSRQHLVALNSLDAKAFLKIGQKLRYNNRKIVPQRMKDGIVVNIPDRTLYLFRKGRLAVSIPVALGVAVKNDKYDWKTPTGKFKITAKAKDPTWYVPPSIQSEMEEQGKEVITSIPPGPANPLGKFAFKTSIPGILIHSTTKPWSIYSYASHGCIRVYPDRMEELFKEVSVNTPGEIIYRPVKLAVTEQGRVFLEVHQDVYGKSSGLAREARLQIERQNLGERVDWKKVDAVLRQKAGIAEDVTL